MREFRIINEIEKEILLNSLSESISNNLKQLLEKDFKFYIHLDKSQEEFPSIFLVKDELSKLLTEKVVSFNTNSAGIYFGFIKRGKFYLSLEGTQFLLKFNIFSPDQKIIIDRNGEKSVLYGNNILKKMVHKDPKNLFRNKFLLIFNQFNELISIAVSQYNFIEYENLEPDSQFAINLMDKGYYLRRQK